MYDSTSLRCFAGIDLSMRAHAQCRQAAEVSPAHQRAQTRSSPVCQDRPVTAAARHSSECHHHRSAQLHQERRQPKRAGHSALVTAANVHDKHPLPNLLHGNEHRAYDDSAYASQKALIRGKAPKAKDFTNQRTRRTGEAYEILSEPRTARSHASASRLEHVFGVVKRLWGFGKVRYRGLQKKTTRAFTALANSNLARGRLHGQVRP